MYVHPKDKTDIIAFQRMPKNGIRSSYVCLCDTRVTGPLYIIHQEINISETDDPVLLQYSLNGRSPSGDGRCVYVLFFSFVKVIRF